MKIAVWCPLCRKDERHKVLLRWFIVYWIDKIFGTKLRFKTRRMMD